MGNGAENIAIIRELGGFVAEGSPISTNEAILCDRVDRLTAERDKYKSALDEIKHNQNDFCTTCDENVDTAALALNWAAKG